MSNSEYTKTSALDKWGYVIKRCKICGSRFGKTWRTHWKRQHPGKIPEIIGSDSEPTHSEFKLRKGGFQKGHDSRRHI